MVNDANDTNDAKTKKKQKKINFFYERILEYLYMYHINNDNSKNGRWVDEVCVQCTTH